MEPIGGLTNAPLGPRMWAKYGRQSSAAGRLLVRHPTSREFSLFIGWSLRTAAKLRHVLPCALSRVHHADEKSDRTSWTQTTVDFLCFVRAADGRLHSCCCQGANLLFAALLLLEDLLALQWNYLLQQLAESLAALKDRKQCVGKSYLIGLVIFFINFLVSFGSLWV